MKITINGESRDVPGDVLGEAPGKLTLSTLLAHLEITPSRVAVERNRAIVPRDQWDATLIHHGDNLEIVHLVGGG